MLIFCEDKIFYNLQTMYENISMALKGVGGLAKVVIAAEC